MKDRSEDKFVELIHTCTEEGKKVSNLGRFGKTMYYQVFEKVKHPVFSVKENENESAKESKCESERKESEFPGLLADDLVSYDVERVRQRREKGENGEKDKEVQIESVL